MTKLLVALTLLVWLQPQYSAAQSVIYVDTDATGANTGQSWQDAFTDLQAGLLAATAGDEIWVADSTYVPTTGIDRNATFHLKDDGAALSQLLGTFTPFGASTYGVRVTGADLGY